MILRTHLPRTSLDELVNSLDLWIATITDQVNSKATEKTVSEYIPKITTPEIAPSDWGSQPVAAGGTVLIPFADKGTTHYYVKADVYSGSEIYPAIILWNTRSTTGVYVICATTGTLYWHIVS
jgi:hypothetical protein